MQAHLLPLIRRQRPGLLPDPRVDRDPTEVVEKPRPPDRRHTQRVDPAEPRRRGGELGDAGGVAGEVRRDEVGEVPHRRKRAIESLRLQHERRGRLQGEDLFPRRGALLEREDLRSLVHETGSHLRVEGVPGALAHEARGVLRAAEKTLEGGVCRDVDDPHRHGDLPALGPAQRALAVPALGEVGEQTRHGRGSADPIRQHPRDLAGRAQGGTRFASHPRKPAGGLKRANERRAARIGQRAEQPREDLSRRPVHERVEAGRQRAAEDLRGDVGLGRAAGVREQAGVVGLRCASVGRRPACRRGASRSPSSAARARTEMPCRDLSPGRARRSARRCGLARCLPARLPRGDTIPSPCAVADAAATWGELPIGGIAQRS